MNNSHLGGHCNITHTDEGALKFLADLGVTSILDLGCGPGGQVALAKRLGFKAIGVDGDLSVKPDILHDFTSGSLNLASEWDVVWSVEFVEHVEEKFISNIASMFSKAKIVVMTHALPGAKGHHHVNLQKPEYWKGFMVALGFVFDDVATQKIRLASTMRREFLRKNGMFFRRNS